MVGREERRDRGEGRGRRRKGKEGRRRGREEKAKGVARRSIVRGVVYSKSKHYM